METKLGWTSRRHAKYPSMTSTCGNVGLVAIIAISYTALFGRDGYARMDAQKNRSIGREFCLNSLTEIFSRAQRAQWLCLFIVVKVQGQKRPCPLTANDICH